jgi:hypothetical protein
LLTAAALALWATEGAGQTGPASKPPVIIVVHGVYNVVNQKGIVVQPPRQPGWANQYATAWGVPFDPQTGDAITEVLDQAEFPAGERVIDAGQGTMSRWWDQGTAIQAFRDLEETEAGFLRETKDGKIAFEDRAHRLSGPHTASQATFGGGNLVLWNPQQGDSSKGIFNYIEAAVRSFDVSEEMVLWTLGVRPGDATPRPKPAQ